MFRFMRTALVMAGFIPAIHVGEQCAIVRAFGPTWMPRTSRGMTE